jgi:hypothetical protein
MKRMVYFVAMPIAKRDDSVLLPDEDAGTECADAKAAIWLAEQMARTPGYIGALAFVRIGYPDGRYEDAQIIKRCGSFTLRWSDDRRAWIA